MFQNGLNIGQVFYGFFLQFFCANTITVHQVVTTSKSSPFKRLEILRHNNEVVGP
jgi:hypothetical protein